MWYAFVFTCGCILTCCGIARYFRYKEEQLIKSILDTTPKPVLKIVRREK